MSRGLRGYANVLVLHLEVFRMPPTPSLYMHFSHVRTLVLCFTFVYIREHSPALS